MFPHNSVFSIIELHRIESHRIESYRIVLNRFYQHASFLVSYRAHVSRYESDRLCHERFTPLVDTHIDYISNLRLPGCSVPSFPLTPLRHILPCSAPASCRLKNSVVYLVTLHIIIDHFHFLHYDCLFPLTLTP